jgi:hypothetical protein
MSDLPIRRVVLYKHGVGYFERGATIDGDQALALSFKQAEVSDVLKSLTVLDLDGGTVSAVSYDSTKPLEQLLAEIALTIPDEGSLKALLPQLKGARVSAKPTGGTAIQGVILGIDTAETRTESGVQQTVRLSILTDTADVRTFDLFDTDLTLLDESMKRDLDFYLKTQLAGKKKDARTFTLFAQGTGKRAVRVSYVLEAPVWKATYRVILSESEQPLIQGWAVVDNVSDEDWENVELTLVAGLPVSFVHDLYTPRYIRRPVVQVRETTGVLPPVAEAGDDFLDFRRLSVDFDPPEMAASAIIPANRAGAKFAKSLGGMERAQSAVSSVQSQTRERQVGDLFEYVIEKAVTVRRNQSALVPILLKPFAGRSVLLYQKAARAENPMRCVEFENTTGLTLEGGPVTVLEQGSYVGEAMLDTMKPTEKRLVGYAVELAVRVLDNVDSSNDHVSRVTIKNGLLHTYRANVLKTTYTFVSKADKEQTLYLDHPRNGSSWELMDDQKPHEVTENFWRFKLPLPPGKTTKFAVRQQQTVAATHGLHDLTEKQLTAWVSAKYLDKKTEKALRDAVAQRGKVSELEERQARLSQERSGIHAEQKRVRDNLGSLGERASEKELRERFVRSLGMQEDRLEEMTAEEKALTAEVVAARAKLTDLIAALAYDAAVSLVG